MHPGPRRLLEKLAAETRSPGRLRRGEQAFFLRMLVDGDVASNTGNWQWVAGTGTDQRPNRVFNPLGQARRFDPDGAYVRRYVPELAGVPGSLVHEPWKLEPGTRWRLRYPPPLVDHERAAERFLARRRAQRRGAKR